MSEKEWRDWIAQSNHFGVLAVPNEPGKGPVMVPTHFTLVENEIWLHLHRNNSALPLLETAEQVSLSIYGDVAYIPNQWRAKDQSKLEEGVATSYYAAVNFSLKPNVKDSEEDLAEILNAQMAAFQPDGGYAEISVGAAPFAPLFGAIRGLKLEIIEVEAKFKYDDHKTTEFRTRIASKLDSRDEGQDASAAKQQRRRLEELGEWRSSAN